MLTIPSRLGGFGVDSPTAAVVTFRRGMPSAHCPAVLVGTAADAATVVAVRCYDIV